MSHISVAESCTGGLLAKYLTDLPGSSDFFKLGIITYSNSAKHDILSVKQETLNQYGAVSEQCVHEMLVGLQKIAKTHICIATSGIAGPAGDTSEKPVGLVYIGWLINDYTSIESYNLKGSREEIRVQTCHIAIQKTLTEIRKIK